MRALSCCRAHSLGRKQALLLKPFLCHFFTIYFMFGIKHFLENVTDSKVMKHAGWLQAADAQMSPALHSGPPLRGVSRRDC